MFVFVVVFVIVFVVIFIVDFEVIVFVVIIIIIRSRILHSAPLLIPGIAEWTDLFKTLSMRILVIIKEQCVWDRYLAAFCTPQTYSPEMSTERKSWLTEKAGARRWTIDRKHENWSSPVWYLTWLDLTWLDLTWLDLTRRDATRLTDAMYLRNGRQNTLSGVNRQALL